MRTASEAEKAGAVWLEAAAKALVDYDKDVAFKRCVFDVVRDGYRVDYVNSHINDYVWWATFDWELLAMLPDTSKPVMWELSNAIARCRRMDMSEVQP